MPGRRARSDRRRLERRGGGRGQDTARRGIRSPVRGDDARKRARLWRLAVAWAAAHRDVVQGRRLRIDAIGLTGAAPASARLEHLVDVEVP
jgi:putative endonuclease